MTDSWKEPTLQIYSPSKSQSSTSFSKYFSQTKLKIDQDIPVVTGSNGLNSPKVDKLSQISVTSDSEQNSQENQKPSSPNCRIIPIECTNKKLKNKPEKNLEIKNGRKWKYANVERRRPLHPDFPESPIKESEMTEVLNSNLEQSHVNEEIEDFSDCEKCEQLSTDFQNCDSFNVTSSSNKTFNQPQLKETAVFKRKIFSSSSSLPCIHQKSSSEISISKQDFYGKKLSEQFQVYANGNFNKAPSGCKVFVMASSSPRKIRSSKMKLQEPECLTISSDEEENSSSRMEVTANTISVLGINKLEQKDICLPDSTTNIENENFIKEKLTPSENTEEELDKGEQKSLEKVILKCRSVRIGSFKVAGITSMEVCINSQDLEFHVPTVPNCNELVKVILSTEDIIRVLGHFGQTLPVLYIYTTPACGSVIRNDLKMSGQTGPFYDPGGTDETQKRITILPEFITNCQKTFFRRVFPGKLLQEIDQKNANEILVRSTPHNQQMKSSLIPAVITRSQASTIQIAYSSPKKPVIKLLTYPPPPQTGGITITTEDLECLNAGEFLNDVIIDFYLKYLVMEKLSDPDKTRTHIFSSFFYPRLTQKVNTRNSSEDDIAMSPQAKRHSQVKTWTRHVDIFEKDFIIIPINQNSHWFLAIICFPGLVPEKTIIQTNTNELPIGEMEPSPSPSPSPSPAPSPSQKFSHVSSPAPRNQQSIGCIDDEYQNNPKTNEELENEISMDSESPIPSKYRNIEAQDYSEESLPTTMDFEESRIEKRDCNEIEKQPCILMFDSLAGPSRWRIVGTLREYLAVEWYTKKGKKRIFDRDTMRGFTPRVPQQTNYSDCGIYVLQYVESFFKKPLQKFSSPLPSLEDWFTEESIMQKRDELRTLILQLQKEQNSGNNEISAESATTVPTSTICLQGEENEQR